MKGRVYGTTREALHNMVRDFCERDSAKTALLLQALDCKPSSLSAMTALYESESTRNPSPEHIERIQDVTQNDSLIRTLADRFGYDPESLRPKADRIPEIVTTLVKHQEQLEAQSKRIAEAIQLALTVPLVATAGPKRAR